VPPSNKGYLKICHNIDTIKFKLKLIERQKKIDRLEVNNIFTTKATVCNVFSMLSSGTIM